MAPLIIVVMGVSGAGKTTIGQRLAAELGWPFYEGDDYHLQASVQKMRQGIPLVDTDRIPWLEALNHLITGLDRGSQSAVIVCSALKEAYRQALARGCQDVRFVYLQGIADVVLPRLEARQGHFMKPGMLAGQFEALEEPADAAIVDIRKRPDEIVREIRKTFGI